MRKKFRSSDKDEGDAHAERGWVLGGQEAAGEHSLFPFVGGRKRRQARRPALLVHLLRLISFPSKVADHNTAGHLLHSSSRFRPTT